MGRAKPQQVTGLFTRNKENSRMASPAWLEHATVGLENRCSIELSYGDRLVGLLEALGEVCSIFSPVPHACPFQPLLTCPFTASSFPRPSTKRWIGKGPAPLPHFGAGGE